jgi:hypothetical protein
MPWSWPWTRSARSRPPRPHRPLSARPPDDPGADDPRLRPPGHDQPVRRLRRRLRLGDRPVLPPPPAPGVPPLPEGHRHRRPKDLDLHLVLDNYATCKTPAIHQWLVRHPRFRLHFTPTSSSWLNLEVCFSVRQRKLLTPDDFEDPDELAAQILAFEKHYNAAARPFDWKFTRTDLNRL